MIRDRLVVGIRDTGLSQQLQLSAELTLEKAKTKVHQREAVGEQQKELQSPETSLGEVRPKRPSNRKSTRNRGKERNGRCKSNALPATVSCSRCGKEPCLWEKCPAKDATCHKCIKKGHQCFIKEIATESPLDATLQWKLNRHLRGPPQSN